MVSQILNLGKSGTGAVIFMLDWKCLCGGTIVWGGDDTFEDCGFSGEGIVSNAACDSCGRTLLLMTPMEDFQ